MRSSSYQNRFSGIARLYGQSGLEKFQRSHIAVVGIGGIGSWVAESLARSGIGKITLIDLDDICVSNTNRQIHALANNIGRSKTEVMSERLKLINPEIKVIEIDDFVSLDNYAEYITTEFDYVVDAIDSVISKAAMIAHCIKNNINILCMGAAGGQIDPTQIKIKDLSRTTVDPLLSKIRNELRRKYHFPRNVKRKFGVEAVYSEEQIIYPWPNGELSHARPDFSNVQSSGAKLDCEGGLGAASFVTASFAFVGVARVLEQLVNLNPNSLKVL